jgi:ribosomal-protein-alanine N-acetyltransferase
MPPATDAAAATSFIATQDAARMAALHAQAFETAWRETAFSQALATPHGHAFAVLKGTQWQGFILLQRLGAPINGVADEAEILTLAVRPDARRCGFGKALIDHAVAHLSLDKIILEVAADNEAACALYRACGFHIDGRRSAYYKKPDGSRTDAILMHAFFS